MLEALQSLPDKKLPPFQFDIVSRAITPLSLGHGAAGVLNGELYQLGGVWSAGSTVNRVFKYNPTSNTWVEVASRPETFHSQSMAFEFNGRLITVNRAGDKFLRYEPISNVWDAATTPAFPEKIDGTRPFAIYKNKLMVLALNADTSMVIYDLVLNTWQRISLTTSPSYGSVFAHHKKKLYTISREKRLVSLDLEDLVWAELAPMPMAGTSFYGADCFVYGDDIYVVGGWNGNSVNQLCFVYNITTNTWTQPRTIAESGYTNNVRGIDGRFYLLKANTTGSSTSGVNTFSRLN